MSFPFGTMNIFDQDDSITVQSASSMHMQPEQNIIPTFDVIMIPEGIENCTHDPQPEPGVFTLMGTICGSTNLNEIYEAILLVRNAGFIVNVVPNTTSPPSEESEFRYIKESRYFTRNIEVFKPKRDTPVACISTKGLDRPWIYIRCEDREIKTQLLNTLPIRFELASFEHKTLRLDTTNLPSQYYITVTTGNGAKGNGRREIGSYFELKFDFGRDGENKKVIGKSLCAYCNGEIDLCGPTIETLEIASEWRGHGLGSAFLKEIEKFFRDQFDSFEAAGIIVFINCSNIKPQAASRWFERKGFRPIAFGEDLSKPLYDYY